MATSGKGKRTRVVDLKQVGQRVRDLRGDMSQRELAALLGSAQGWLSELEKGLHKSMEVDTVVRLARALSVSADYLLGLTDIDAPVREPPRSRRTKIPPTKEYDHA